MKGAVYRGSGGRSRKIEVIRWFC